MQVGFFESIRLEENGYQVRHKTCCKMGHLINQDLRRVQKELNDAGTRSFKRTKPNASHAFNMVLE